MASHLPENTITLLEDRFHLGWSHYVTLLTIDNVEARRFYEIEATGNASASLTRIKDVVSALGVDTNNPAPTTGSP